MTVSMHAHFSEEERKMLATLADNLMTVCHKIECGVMEECAGCPLNALTDRAYALGKDITALLHQGEK